MSGKELTTAEISEALWEWYDLELHLDKITGGLPKHPDIIRRWQEANWPAGGQVPAPGRPLDAGGNPVPARTVDQAVAETLETVTVDEAVKGIWTGFAERDGMAWVENRLLKAMFKEAANIVKTMTVLRDPVTSKPPGYLRSKVAERVFVTPKWIPVCPLDEVKSQERPIHVMTMQGPRTALKRVDYAEDVVLRCRVQVLADGVVTERVLRVMLAYAQQGGLGTDRSTGSGTFGFQLARSAG